VGLVRVRATDTTNFVPAGQSSSDTRAAPRFGAGVLWRISGDASLMLEYRYTRVSPRFRWDNSVGATLGGFTFDIHTVAGGIAFAFR
jgi:opacity protein-like surface antigen